MGFGAGINPGREALAVAAHAFGDQFVDQRLVGGADQRHQVARRAADGIALALHLHGEIGGDPALLAFPAGGEIGNEYGEHFFCLENHLPVVESRATNEYEGAMSDDELTLEERVFILEVLVEASIWGPHLHARDHRQRIAQDLYARLEADARHPSFPSRVRSGLARAADALSELDNIPDSLRPALRPFARPADSDG